MPHRDNEIGTMTKPVKINTEADYLRAHLTVLDCPIRLMRSLKRSGTSKEEPLGRVRNFKYLNARLSYVFSACAKRIKSMRTDLDGLNGP